MQSKQAEMNAGKSHNSSMNNNALRPLIIIGAGGHALSVANVAISAGYQILSFIDKDRDGQKLFGKRVLANLSALDNPAHYSFAIGIGDNSTREIIYQDLIASYRDLHFPVLLHPSAVVSPFSRIGEGTVIMPQANVGPQSEIGHFCIINTLSSIDHECLMHHYSSLAPGAVTGGKVAIGIRSAVSLGAKIKHGVTIGDDCVVGANSYLSKDLPRNQLAYGTPAKAIRTRESKEKYLT